MGWWRHFVSMPDRARAKVLARASAGVILALLYSLGGGSLYLRARYLKPTQPAETSTATATSTASPVGEQSNTLPTLTPTTTLFPTMTPRNAMPAASEGAEWPTITPTVLPPELLASTPLPTAPAQATTVVRMPTPTSGQ